MTHFVATGLPGGGRTEAVKYGSRAPIAAAEGGRVHTEHLLAGGRGLARKQADPRSCPPKNVTAGGRLGNDE